MQNYKISQFKNTGKEEQKSTLTTAVKGRQNKSWGGIRPLYYLFDTSALIPVLGEVEKQLQM